MPHFPLSIIINPPVRILRTVFFEGKFPILHELTGTKSNEFLILNQQINKNYLENKKIRIKQILSVYANFMLI
jgi:hypothetical protein